MPRQLSPIINKALTTTVDTLYISLPESGVCDIFPSDDDFPTARTIIRNPQVRTLEVSWMETEVLTNFFNTLELSRVELICRGRNAIRHYGIFSQTFCLCTFKGAQAMVWRTNVIRVCQCQRLKILRAPEFGTLIYKVPTVVVSGLLIIARQLSSYLFYRSLSYSGH